MYKRLTGSKTEQAYYYNILKESESHNYKTALIYPVQTIATHKEPTMKMQTRLMTWVLLENLEEVK